MPCPPPKMDLTLGLDQKNLKILSPALAAVHELKNLLLRLLNGRRDMFKLLCGIECCG